jgi:hypothetical protein
MRYVITLSNSSQGWTNLEKCDPPRNPEGRSVALGVGQLDIWIAERQHSTPRRVSVNPAHIISIIDTNEQ